MTKKPENDIEACLSFIREIDALKGVERRTKPMTVDRRENSAEHSWHLAMMAMVFAPMANGAIDLNKVLKMLLLHDVPEVYADDVLVYDRTEDHAVKEREAAEKLFGMLPGKIGEEFRAIWEEFEAGESEEAKFARALDRFQPCLCNFENKGGTWLEFGISQVAVLDRNRPIEQGSTDLWRYLQDMLETAQARGYFPNEKDVNYG